MDDLSRLLVQQPQPGARFGQGTLREWNPDTFEHVIEWRGLRIRDATILAGVDALTWQPGDQVLLLGADQSGRRGWTDWMVLGRAITPGPGAADQAIAPMRTSLAQRLSIDVIRSRFHHQVAVSAHVNSRNAFDDPSEGDPRPVISNVEIVTGVAVVWLSGQFVNLNYPVDPNGVGDLVMSVEVSGATFRSPSHEQAVSIGRSYSGGDTRPSGRIGSTVIFDDLNPGVHTFTAKYMAAGTLNSGLVLAPRMVVLGM